MFGLSTGFMIVFAVAAIGVLALAAVLLAPKPKRAEKWEKAEIMKRLLALSEQKDGERPQPRRAFVLNPPGLWRGLCRLTCEPRQRSPRPSEPRRDSWKAFATPALVRGIPSEFLGLFLAPEQRFVDPAPNKLFALLLKFCVCLTSLRY